ncbi:hypothetical protein [Thiorhodovibrio frisius]|nr:hypothetical protein [Thiorhodovibrio frisius]WPL20019.1 hypothetical protein Thiofri_00070 [Thiorhodovibrio frisius]
MPKCGSSALQVFLAKNRQRLLAEGIDYLALSDLSQAKKGGITSGNAGFLSRSMLDKADEGYFQDDGTLYQSLLDAVSNTKTESCLLSSEFFAFVGTDAYRKLLEDLRAQDCQAKCIYYVRRQDQVLVSGYMQKVKRHHYTGDPETFVRDTYQEYVLLRYYDSARRFEQLFGAGNLIVGLYEATQRHPKGIAGDFLAKLLGHCPKWVAPQPAVNPSPSPVELKLMLAANRYRPRMRFSDILAANSAGSGRSRPYERHHLLAPAMTETVLDYFAEQNQLLAEHYTHGEAFPPYQASPHLDLNNIPVDADDLMDIVAGFLVNFDQRLAKLEQSAVSSG